MWWPFGKKRSRRDKLPTAKSFVEATGGGWHDVPATVATDGGGQAGYVDHLLRQAAAIAQGYAVGDSFEFIIDDIPTDIDSPHEIVFGLMMLAGEYGLAVESVVDETAIITRLE